MERAPAETSEERDCPHPPEYDRPRCETDEEGHGQGGKAVVHGPCADGQQAWAGERPSPDLGVRDGREGSGAGHADADTRRSATERRSRQELRHRGLRCRVQGAEYRPARRSEEEVVGDRRAVHAP